MNLTQPTLRYQSINYNKYLVFVINKVDSDTSLEEDDSDKSNPSASEESEGKQISIRKIAYLKSNLRRIVEDDPKLVLRRTEETYKMTKSQLEESGVEKEEETTRASTSRYEDPEPQDDVHPLLSWIPSREIGEIIKVGQEEPEEEDTGEVITQKSKRISIIDSSFPVKKTSAKEDLEILKRFEGIKIILDEEFKFVTEDDANLNKTEAVEDKEGKQKVDKKDDEDITIVAEAMGENDKELHIAEDISAKSDEKLNITEEEVKDHEEIREREEKTTREVEKLTEGEDIMKDDLKLQIMEEISKDNEELNISEGSKIRDEKLDVVEVVRGAEGVVITEDEILPVVEKIAMKDDGKLNAMREIVAPILSSLLTNIFEFVVEEQMSSIYKEYSETKAMVMDIINVLNFLIQELELKSKPQVCVCRKKKGIPPKKENTRRVCRCKRKETVITQKFVSRVNTVDKAIQNVVHEIYNTVPSKKYLQLQEVVLDNSLVHACALKMSSLMCLDIAIRGQRKLKISPEFYRLEQNIIKKNSRAPCGFLENLLRRSSPALLDREETNPADKFESRTEIVESKLNTQKTILTKADVKQKTTRILNVPCHSHNLNISLNARTIEVQILPNSRRVFLAHGKFTYRLT